MNRITTSLSHLIFSFIRNSFFLDCLNFLRSLSLSIREVCSFQHTGMQKSILFDDDHKEVVVEKRVKE